MANIGSTNEKPFISIISNQPTILIISNFLKESVFRKFTASHASHGWEAVNNHMCQTNLLRQAREPSEEFIS